MTSAVIVLTGTWTLGDAPKVAGERIAVLEPGLMGANSAPTIRDAYEKRGDLDNKAVRWSGEVFSVERLAFEDRIGIHVGKRMRESCFVVFPSKEEVATRVEEGDRVEIEFTLPPAGPTLRAEGRVVWTSWHGDEGEEGRFCETGVQISGVDESVEQQLFEYASQPANRRRYQITSEVTHGVVITWVRGGSSAAAARLLPGDVLLEVKGEKVTSVRRFERLWRKAKGKTALVIYRRGRVFYIAVDR